MQTVNLDALETAISEQKDLIDLLISGTVRPVHEFERHNYFRLRLRDLVIPDIDLTRSDFKDTLVESSYFLRCMVKSTNHSASLYIDTIFEECTFYDAGFFSNEYRRVIFKSCNLQNALIKNSRFFDCRFETCLTDTHVFETCIFQDCLFESCELEARSIYQNFGLRSDACKNTTFRSGRRSHQYRELDRRDLIKILQLRKEHPLHLFRLSYFLNPDIAEAGEYLWNALSLATWLDMARFPTNFVELLESVTEYFMQLFDRDEATYHVVMILHETTRLLMEAISRDESCSRLHLSVAGAHLAVSRTLEPFADLLHLYLLAPPARLSFLADGPLEKAYFDDALEPFLNRCGVQIIAVCPHNSPVEVVLGELVHNGFVMAIGWYLATQTRLQLRAFHLRKFQKELECADTTAPSRTSTYDIVTKTSTKEESVFDLYSGCLPSDPEKVRFRIKALTPYTSFLIDLKLDVDTRILRRVGKTLKNITRDDPAE